MKLPQGIKKVVDSYHYENQQGQEVLYCESCQQFKPMEEIRSQEDCDMCLTCVQETEVGQRA